MIRGTITRKACNRCRSRKRKCDGQTPCLTCSAINVVCTYKETMGKRGPKTKHEQMVAEMALSRPLEAQQQPLDTIFQLVSSEIFYDKSISTAGFDLNGGGFSSLHDQTNFTTAQNDHSQTRNRFELPLITSNYPSIINNSSQRRQSNSSSNLGEYSLKNYRFDGTGTCFGHSSGSRSNSSNDYQKQTDTNRYQPYSMKKDPSPIKETTLPKMYFPIIDNPKPLLAPIINIKTNHNTASMKSNEKQEPQQLEILSSSPFIGYNSPPAAKLELRGGLSPAREPNWGMFGDFQERVFGDPLVIDDNEEEVVGGSSPSGKTPRCLFRESSSLDNYNHSNTDDDNPNSIKKRNSISSISFLLNK